MYSDYRGWFRTFDADIRLGCDIGVRIYASRNKCKGAYFQLQTGLFYCSEAYYYDSKKEIFMNYDVMCYLGWAGKYSNFSIFLDIGMGYGRSVFQDIGFIPDMNIGIGIPIQKYK